MKNYIKLLVPTIVLSTTIAFAQNDIQDEIVKENIAEYQIIESKIDDDSRILEDTKAIYPVVFDDDDAKKLNQDRIIIASRLETTFKLDTDKDFDYEREITINYIRPENFNYDFMLTEKGLKVWLDDNDMMVKEIHMIKTKKKKKVNMLTSKGMYNILLSNGEVYEIEVKNMK